MQAIWIMEAIGIMEAIWILEAIRIMEAIGNMGARNKVHVSSYTRNKQACTYHVRVIYRAACLDDSKWKVLGRKN